MFHYLKNCILNANIIAKDEKDNVVFSSKNQSLYGISSFYYDSLIVNSPLYYVLKKHIQEIVYLLKFLIPPFLIVFLVQTI